MSVSSNSRKESTESYAAQQMHNTMGQAPELAQLNDRSLENDLPSRVAGSSDTDVPGDVAADDALVAEADDAEQTGMSQTDIDEASRASWGQPAASMSAVSTSAASTSAASTSATYHEHNAIIESDGDKIADADWNRSTEEGAIPTTRIDEPDRTLGNS